MTLPGLLSLAAFTVQRPRDGAARVLALDLPRSVAWETLALVTVLSLLLSEVSTMLLAAVTGAGVPALFASPLILWSVQMVLLIVTVLAIYGVGRAFGGQGTLQGAVLLVAWLQFILICVQLFQAALMLASPGLAALIGFAALILFLWLLTNFVAELHGFASLGRVFATILAAMFAMAVVLSILLAFLGISLPEGMQNV